MGVQPPNGCVLAQPPNCLGVNVNVLPDGQEPNLPVKFLVQGDGRTLYFMSTVYEQITRNSFPNSQLHLNDQAMGLAAQLNFTGPGEIYDNKGMYYGDNDINNFSQLANNSPPLDEFVQSIAVDVPLGCGGLVIGHNNQPGKLVIGNFHFKIIKVNATQWQLTQVPFP